MSDSERVGTIGSPSTFWLYSSSHGFDLTHPETPTSPPVHPRLTLQTTSTHITIHPPKTALVIIDMQNFFLSPLIGRSPTSLGLAAQTQLIKHAIPAAHKAGIQIIYLNWGLTDEDMQDMPPATVKAFGWYSRPARSSPTETAELKLENNGKDPRQYVGLGQDMGSISGPDSSEEVVSTIDAGRMLFQGSWNAHVTPELEATMYTDSDRLHPPDVVLRKNRLSGLWGGAENTDCGRFLREKGIRTLLFAGVNTDVSLTPSSRLPGLVMVNRLPYRQTLLPNRFD